MCAMLSVTLCTMGNRLYNIKERVGHSYVFGLHSLVSRLWSDLLLTNQSTSSNVTYYVQSVKSGFLCKQKTVCVCVSMVIRGRTPWPLVMIWSSDKTWRCSDYDGIVDHAIAWLTPQIILLCKAKRQYLLTWKVRRYSLLALHGIIHI